MYDLIHVRFADLTDRHGQAGSLDIVSGEKTGDSGAFRDQRLIDADALRQQPPADDRAAFQFGHVHDIRGNLTGGNKPSAGNMLRFQTVRDVQMPVDDHIVRDERFIVVGRTSRDINCFHVQNSFLFMSSFFTLLPVLL